MLASTPTPTIVDRRITQPLPPTFNTSQRRQCDVHKRKMSSLESYTEVERKSSTQSQLRAVFSELKVGCSFYCSRMYAYFRVG